MWILLSVSNLPILVMRPGKSNAICFLIKHWLWSIFATCFNCVREKISFEKISRLMMGLWSSSTTVTSMPVAIQSLHLIDLLITQTILILSLEKVFRSCMSCDCNQYFSLHSDTTVFARLLIIIVHTLPKFTNAVVFDSRHKCLNSPVPPLECRF